jgi:drug/metabolite transporter (DMT)-like permease
MLWIPIAIGAATLQVARNAAQRGLLAEAGPWGATLVRFLFGLPFAVAFALSAAAFSGLAWPSVSPRFLIACIIGGAAQIAATAAMLVAMRRSSFAIGTVFQQSSIPFAALIGLALGEPLGDWTWAGLALATGGLVALGWPKSGVRDWSAAGLGLLSGLGFAVSANGVRQATHALDAGHPIFAALCTVVVVQAMQTLALGGWLAATDRRALRVVAERWRESLPAGFFGAAASALWFTAFALAPAGPVRAVGVVETPIAAVAGPRLFDERLSAGQLGLIVLVAIGVILAATGGHSAHMHQRP